MAYTEITVQSPGNAGAVITEAAMDAVNGNKFANDGRTFLQAHNTNEAADTATVTILTGASVGGFAVADRTVTLAAGATKIIGPFNQAVFNQTASPDIGAVAFTVAGDAAADLDVGAFH